MTLQCIVLDDYQQAAVRYADWSTLGSAVAVTVLSEHIEDEDALIERLAQAEILVIMRERTAFPAARLRRLPKLRLLITSGLRNASIDLNAARDCNITVCGTSSASEPPAELTWALMLALARHVPQENAALRANGRWQSSVGTDLHGATLGLLGLGKIGKQVARVGQAFGMQVLAWSPNLTQARTLEAGVVLAPSKEALLEASDFVSIHLVLGERSRGLLGAADLARMRPSAFLINTSRAAIVDQDALVQALEHGRIAGAGLDVFDLEPLPPDHPYRRLPNVLATPHLGYVSARNYTSYFSGAVENISAWLAGAPVRTLT